jgi:DNA gyrase/topoisomerase IV subunit B
MSSSNYPKYYDLNIGKVLIHLDIEDSIKEIISNSLDEHILQESKKDIKIYKNDDDKWCIRDYGRGVKATNLNKLI